MIQAKSGTIKMSILLYLQTYEFLLFCISKNDYWLHGQRLSFRVILHKNMDISDTSQIETQNPEAVEEVTKMLSE